MSNRLPKLLAAAGLATLALAAPASADSISFIRAGDVWVASPDGSKQVQITHTGGQYSYASQADDGTFIALAGRRLHRLDRKGNVLADFATPVSGDAPAVPGAPPDSKFAGPWSPEISPDGRTVVYEYTWTYKWHDPTCAPGDESWGCNETKTFVGSAYTHSDRLTGWDEPGMGNRSGWLYPSWMDDDTIMASTPSEPLNDEVVFNDRGASPQEFRDWFTDDGVWHMKDGAATRQGDKLAFVTTRPHGFNDPWMDDFQVTVYKTTGAPPAKPQRCFSFDNGKMAKSPSFSPDGSRLVWHDRTFGSEYDTYRILAGDANGACNPDAPGIPAQVIVDDAVYPDYGPADVPGAGREAEQGQGAAKPGGGGDDTAGPQPLTSTQARKVSLGRGALRRALRNGLVVRFRVPAAGMATAKASVGAKAVATGSRRAAKAGTVAVRLRFSAAGRRALRGRRSARLAVRMEFRGA
jgi:hypothetical protein